MSAWLLATREVHEAGGKKPINKMWSSLAAIRKAREMGMICPAAERGAPSRRALVVLTPLGLALCEYRVEFYTPYVPATNGRAFGTHRRLRVTWLAALPHTGGLL